MTDDEKDYQADQAAGKIYGAMLRHLAEFFQIPYVEAASLAAAINKWLTDQGKAPFTGRGPDTPQEKVAQEVLEDMKPRKTPEELGFFGYDETEKMLEHGVTSHKLSQKIEKLFLSALHHMARAKETS